MSKDNIYKLMEDDINNSQLDDQTKIKMLKNVSDLKQQKVNILITGSTGCGKSSTINAMFDCEVAKVGIGVDPETMNIQRYELNNLILWDSPGLGDGKEADNRHAKNIINKLMEVDNQGNALIDLVLVILDGSSRDLGTSYELINQVIIPNLGDDKQNRILIAINQCDVAMKGRHWNYEKNEPEAPLIEFLEKKVESTQRRIFEATQVHVNPIYYSAGYKDGDNGVQQPYNLAKLLYFIVQYTPKNKRLAYANNINQNQEMWKHNDDLKNYVEETKQSMWETVKDYSSKGAKEGGSIGEAIGGVIFGGSTGRSVGRAVGSVVGGVVGAVGGFLAGLFG